MENILPIDIQEVVFSSSDSKRSRLLKNLEREGKIRKISPRIYSSNFKDNAETIILRNLFFILGNLYPDALLSHRSALEFKPTATGNLFLTYTYTKRISLPGVTLQFLTGRGPIEGDNPLSGKLFVSQIGRALLENFQVTRKMGSESKSIGGTEIEAALEKIIRVTGEKGLNELRDNAKKLAAELSMQREFALLDKMIGALLSSKPSKLLSSPLAIARALGQPYDPARMGLFEKLFVTLQQQHFAAHPIKKDSEVHFKNFAFYEAYFSNYIEGTEFELEEAKRIIESGRPMPARHEDSHDILGTYQIVSNTQEMKILPENAEALIEILLQRHKVMMRARTLKMPGVFKTINNRAGETFFVDHTLVKGTLIRAYDYLKALEDPFARASFIMFMISEVHPFLDGNGRMARIMMNAELVNKNQTKILIPTVYREDYLGALRKLTRHGDTAAYIRMLKKAHAFSALLEGENIDEMGAQLAQYNAFKEPEAGKLTF
jgi:hypothetical protein